MKIKQKEKPAKPVNIQSLEGGSVFEFENGLYIKISETESKINAVLLYNGVPCLFGEYIKCREIDGEFVRASE